MKKLVSLLLALAACGTTPAPTEPAPTEPAPTAAPTEAATQATTEAALVVDTCILKEADDKMLNTYSAIAVNQCIRRVRAGCNRLEPQREMQSARADHHAAHVDQRLHIVDRSDDVAGAGCPGCNCRHGKYSAVYGLAVDPATASRRFICAIRRQSGNTAVKICRIMAFELRGVFPGRAVSAYTHAARLPA